MKRMLSATAALTLLGAESAESATTVRFSIVLEPEIPADVGLVPGQVFEGALSYDPASVGTVGETTISPVNDPMMTIRFEFAGGVYDELSDPDPEFPQLYFTDGVLVGMNFWAPNHSAMATSSGFVQIETTQVGTLIYYSFDGSGEYGGSIQWTPTLIPESSTCLLWCVAGCVAIFRRSRR